MLIYQDLPASNIFHWEKRRQIPVGKMDIKDGYYRRSSRTGLFIALDVAVESSQGTGNVASFNYT
jgi:hypothetical protein